MKGKEKIMTEKPREKQYSRYYIIECVFYDDENVEFYDSEFKLFFENELEAAKWAIKFSEMCDNLCEIKVTSRVFNYHSENIIIWLGLY